MLAPSCLVRFRRFMFAHDVRPASRDPRSLARPGRVVRHGLAGALVACALSTMTPAIAATTYTWTGAASGLWSNNVNWNPAGVPANGDSIAFPDGAANPDTTNDLPPGRSFAIVAFNAGGYTLGGNGIVVTNAIAGSGSATIDLPVDVQTGAVSINVQGGVRLAGLSGSGPINVLGALYLGGTQSYSGTMTVDASCSSFGCNVGQLYLDAISMPAATVVDNFALSGDGTVGAVTLATSFFQVQLRPGQDSGFGTGLLQTGDLDFGNNTNLYVDIAGTAAATGYDQLRVTGSVNMGANTQLSLNFSGDFSPALNDTFVLIDNDGTDPVIGTFANLPEGAVVSANGAQFTISYAGGSGNDVVLTCILSPRTWTGAVSAFWSDPGNWNPAVVPVSGDTLSFPQGAATTAMSNDLPPGSAFVGLSFAGYGYTLAGNSLTLTSSISGTGNARIDVPIDVQGNAVSIGTSQGLQLTGNLSGSGPIDVLAMLTLSGPHSYSGTITVEGTCATSCIYGQLYLDGASLPAATIVDHNALFGNGTVGTLDFEATYFQTYIQPGSDYGGAAGTGTIHSSHLDFGNYSNVAMDLNGPSAGVGYDQFSVTGTVSMGAHTQLQLTLGADFSPALGEQFVLIDNQGADPVDGTFLGLGEGAVISASGSRFVISYTGGTGNDVTLTCTASAKTWTGANSALWSDPGNWHPAGVPTATDTLLFPPNSSNYSPIDDLPDGSAVTSLNFSGYGYTIGGNRLVVTESIDGNAYAVLTLPVDVSNNAVSFNVQAGIRLEGILSGSGPIDVDGGVSLSAASTYSGILTVAASCDITCTFGQLSLDGAALPDATVVSHNNVSGNGRVGTLATSPTFTQPIVSPGNASGSGTGILRTGDLSMAGASGNSSSLRADINGAAPGAGYDQVSAIGSVSLAGVSLQPSLSTRYIPSLGQEFRLIDNQGTGAVSGTFDNLPEGSIVTLNSVYEFRLSYVGGDGNDVTLESLNGKPATTTTLSSSVDPSTPGQSVVFTATVEGEQGVATGSVDFIDGLTVIGSGTLDAGVATFTTSALAVGSHAIVAQYAGDVTYGGSASDVLTQVVNAYTFTPPVFPALEDGQTTASLSFTVSSAPPTGVTLTPSGAGLTFTPSSLAFGTGETTVAFTVTAAADAGPGPVEIDYVLSGPDAAAYATPASDSITVLGSALAPTYPATVDGATTATLAMTLSVAPPNGIVITPTAAGLTFSPASLEFGSGVTSVDFTVTVGADTGPAAVVVTYVVSGTDAALYATPPSGSFTPQGRFTLPSYPDVQRGSTSAALEITASFAPTSSVVVTPSAPGLVFTPGAITFPAGQATQTFTVQALANAALGATTISYAVSGPDADAYVTPEPGTLTVTARPASVVTINAADLHQTFGATHAVHATAEPASSGSTITLTYDGNATVPDAAGSYAVVATLVDPVYVGSASAVLVIADAADITLSLQSAHAMALVDSHAPYTDPVDYTGLIRNVGAPTAQKVHTVITVVRIDDGNTSGSQPIAIDAADVLACVLDPAGWAAQEPGNHDGCPQDYQSLASTEDSGAFNGRPAVTFRYPNVASSDQPLPVTDPAIAIAPLQFSFKRGDYQVHISTVGDDGTVYATAEDGTTVPDAAVAYAGATSGQAEDALLSTTRLRNNGGHVTGNVIVRVTLSDAAATDAAPIQLANGDADLAYQLGAAYATLPWAGNAADGGLVTYFGPTGGFALEDGYDATTAGRGIFHREGSYRLRYEVLDVATQAVVFASAQTTLVIGSNQVNFALADLQQVYDGTPRAVTVTPANVPHTTIYAPLTGATCPASPTGSSATPPTNAGSYCVYVDATGNYAGGARGTLVIATAAATVTLDDDDGTIDGTIHRAFDGAAQVVTATASALTDGSVEVRYNGDLAAPTAAGSYSLVATIVDANFEGSTTGTLVIAINGGATIVLDDDDGTLDGAIHRAFTGTAVAPVTATTTPGVTYVVTYVGDAGTAYPLTATPPTAAGQYHVVATTTDPNYAPVSASGTLVVDAASATIALDAATLAATYNGQPHAVTATTTPTGLAYTVTYDGSVTPPVGAGSYAIVATVTTPSYTGAASGTLVIAPAIGVVNFGPTNFTFDGQGHATTAVISQEPGDTAACTLSATAGDYPRTEAGSTTVSAVCTGSNYSASGSTTLIVSRKPVSIVLAGLGSFPYDGAAHAATATVSDTVDGFLAAAEVTYDGATAAPTNVGTYAVLATLDAASQVNYSATPANGSIVIGSANATVTLSNLAQVYDGTDRSVTATTTPADLATSITYDGSETPPVNAGIYTVVATITEPGYSGSTSGTLSVARAPASVVLSDLTQAYDGQPKPVTVNTTPEGLALAVSYDGGAIAPTAVGTYAVLATVADPNYAGSASGTLHIVAASADGIAANGTTTFAATAGQPIGGALPSVRVTDAGGNPVTGTTVTFAAAQGNGTLSGAIQVTDGNGVATLGGWTLDATPGTDTVVASAAGVSGTVVFVATGTVSTDALSVTITDGRDFAQVFTALTYTITIGNATSSTMSDISVTDALPPELDVNSAHWQCIGINGGTCTASAIGDLSDTVSLPAGSSVVYLLSATVVGGASDGIVNTISADGPNGSVGATDTTAIVLFRNGFEAGGDGAQGVGNEPGSLGVLDAGNAIDIVVEPAALASLRRVTLASAANGAFRVEAIRIDGAVWVHLVARTGASEMASLWSPMTGNRLSLGLDPGAIVLSGCRDALSVASSSRGPLAIRG